VFMQKGTPGAQHIAPMPEEVHRMVSKIDFNSSLNQIGTFGMTSEQISKMKNRKWKTGLYEGLTKVGRKGHEGYGTFRVVTQNSKGWMFPGVPASPVFKTMAATMGPRIKSILHEGIMRDLEEGLDYLRSKVSKEATI